MTDQKSIPTPADAARISIDQDAELRAWAQKLDATPEQIRQAVATVGDKAADVEMHLKGTRATTNADQEAKAERGDGST